MALWRATPIMVTSGSRPVDLGVKEEGGRRNSIYKPLLVIRVEAGGLGYMMRDGDEGWVRMRECVWCMCSFMLTRGCRRVLRLPQGTTGTAPQARHHNNTRITYTYPILEYAARLHLHFASLLTLLPALIPQPGVTLPQEWAVVGPQVSFT